MNYENHHISTNEQDQKNDEMKESPNDSWDKHRGWFTFRATEFLCLKSYHTPSR